MRVVRPISWLKGGKDHGRKNDGVREELDQLNDDVHMLREELAEIHERMDFTERLLAQGREERVEVRRET